MRHNRGPLAGAWGYGVDSRRTVGRTGELRVLTTVVDGLAAPAARSVHDPVACLIAGEAGIGKSVLWAAAVAHAGRLGYHVLSCRMGEPDAALSFAGLVDLFDGVPEAVFRALPPPQRSALDAALLRAGPVDADRRAVCRAALTAVRTLAATGPLVLAVDDIQWLDPASAEVLGYVLPRVRRDALLLPATDRSA